MAHAQHELAERLKQAFPDQLAASGEMLGEVTIEVAPEHLLAVMQELHDRDEFAFSQCTDVCGVDYAAYGEGEWITEQASSAGFSRGVQGNSFARRGLTGVYGVDEITTNTGRRFAAVYHLLSLRHNQRLRVKCYCSDDNFPVVPSVIGIWAGVNWFEREAFDLYGIVFEGHPDLRRILTDYGFVGHPFRKDFPLIGNVEVRYDEDKRRVVYQPVSIEPRVLVPRVIRHDNRYAERAGQKESNDG